MSDNINIIKRRNVVECGENSLNVAPINDKLTTNSSAYILLRGTCDNGGDCIEPPDRLRNLISIEENCQLNWICQRIPDQYVNDTDGYFHIDIVPNYDKNPITRGPDGRFFEFDHESGKFVDSWEPSKFKLDGELIELNSKIEHIDIKESRYIMRYTEGENTMILCFSRSGELCWEQKLDRHWNFFVRDSYVYVTHGHYSKKLSLEDGSIL